MTTNASPAADFRSRVGGRHAGQRITGTLGSMALIATPLMLVTAAVVHPSHGVDGGSWIAAAVGDPGSFYASHLLLLLACAVSVPAFLALADLVRVQQPVAATVGSTLTVLGLLGIAMLIGTDFAVWQITAVSDAMDAANPALGALEGMHSRSEVLAPLAILLPGTVLGPALLALALHRAHILPAWRAASIPAGLMAVFAGLSWTPVGIMGAAALLMAFAPITHSVLRGPRSGPSG